MLSFMAVAVAVARLAPIVFMTFSQPESVIGKQMTKIALPKVLRVFIRVFN